MSDRHTYATSDEQERELLQLAMALSAAEAPAPAGGRPPPAQQQPPQQQPTPQQQAPSGSGSGAAAAAGSSKLGGLMRALKSGLSSSLSSGADALGMPRCGGCGGAVSGYGEPMLQALGRDWHARCFRCAGCQKPLAGGPGGSGAFQFVPHEGSAYHPACHRELFHPRCSVCRGFIPQNAAGRIEWHMHPFWKDDRFCPVHTSDGTPSCCACGRLEPRGAEWVVLADRQRRLCLECLGSVVIDTQDAQPLYREVLEFFKSQGMPHPYAPPLLLVESGVLEDHASRETGRRRNEEGPVFHVRGLCVATVYTSIPSVVRIGQGLFGVNTQQTALGGFGGLPIGAQQRCTVQSLLVLYGLPRLLCGSIVAHELTHAYIRMQNVAQLDPQIEEGLCQLMAYLWLEGQGHAAQRAGQDRLAAYLGHQIRTDPSATYGDGFRRALELYQARGLRALFDTVLRTRAWPQGWGV